MVDYQIGKFFATASGTYTYRNDITIDRTSYYTTQEVLSNKVDMPDVASFNIRAGYRSDRLIAEAVFAKMQTLGGFDIRKNDMPFPSNKMIATTAGVNGKYNLPWVAGLSLIGGGEYPRSPAAMLANQRCSTLVFSIFLISAKKRIRQLKHPKRTDMKKTILLSAALLLTIMTIETSCKKSVTGRTDNAPALNPLTEDANAGTWKTILIKRPDTFAVAVPVATNTTLYIAELNEIKGYQKNLSAEDQQAIKYWSAGGVFRWNEVMRDLVAKYNFATLSEHKRHLPDTKLN